MKTFLLARVPLVNTAYKHCLNGKGGKCYESIPNLNIPLKTSGFWTLKYKRIWISWRPWAQSMFVTVVSPTFNSPSSSHYTFFLVRKGPRSEPGSLACRMQAVFHKKPHFTFLSLSFLIWKLPHAAVRVSPLNQWGHSHRCESTLFGENIAIYIFDRMDSQRMQTVSSPYSQRPGLCVLSPQFWGEKGIVKILVVCWFDRISNTLVCDKKWRYF